MKNPFEIYTSSTPKKKRQHLDWDESAADTVGYVQETYDTERPVPTLWWLKLAVLVVFTVIIGRLSYLQLVRGSDFRMLSESNRIRKQTLLAPRGLILDRYREPLALNTASFNLVAVPFDLPKEGLDEQVGKLVEMFGLNREELEQQLAKADRKSLVPLFIKQDISQEQSILFETRASEFIGFSIQKIPIREYLSAKAFSHVLGYTGVVSDEDLGRLGRDRYDNFDYTGKGGIEAVYEEYLHGGNGQNLVEVDATGKLLNILGEQSPAPGHTAILNLDKGLQEQLYQALDGESGTVKAAAVALDPRNGQVLAIMSLPGFDNNLFAHGIKKGEYQALLDDKNLPLFNRAIAGTYPPGSTVKPMVAAAALEERIVSDRTIIQDRGVLVIPNQYNPQISYNFYGWKRNGLGGMDARSAIAQSSDIYFYTVAGGHPSSPIQGLGAEKLAEYYRRFNLGKMTGIDLPGERTGLVADPAWKEAYYKGDALLGKWYLGDTYHIAIGQGDMLATPLQVAFWTAMIANDGVGMKPQVLNRIIDENNKIVYENKPEAVAEKPASARNIKVAQEGMRETITEGSGVQLSALPFSSAGKTGTSQFDGSDPTRTHAWFTAYAPFEDPEIVITVLVEAGGEGHAAAVPVVKKALQWWYENRYNK